MNNLFCFAPIDGMTMHYYADGENPYKLIADELVPGPVGFDKNWASKHTISVLKERDDICLLYTSIHLQYPLLD